MSNSLLQEVSEATSNLAAAAVRGVFQGPGTSDKEDGQESVNTSGADRMGRVLDLLTSERYSFFSDRGKRGANAALLY